MKSIIYVVVTLAVGVLIWTFFQRMDKSADDSTNTKTKSLDLDVSAITR